MLRISTVVLRNCGLYPLCYHGQGQSVWIAQRNGRTKDGNDVIDQDSMFCMSCQRIKSKH